MSIDKKYILISLILSTIIILYLSGRMIKDPIKDPINELFINDVNKFKFINYNASWCGWSNKLRSTWAKLMRKYNDDDNIEVINFLCDDDDKNFSKCKSEGVNELPTIISYKNDMEISRYNGDRSFESIDNWLIECLSK